jgi:hypothetical protein
MIINQKYHLIINKKMMIEYVNHVDILDVKVLVFNQIIKITNNRKNCLIKDKLSLKIKLD